MTHGRKKLALASALWLWLGPGLAGAAEVELPHAMTFETPGDALIDVAAGRYGLSSDGAETITLVPAEGGEPIHIDADQSDRGPERKEEGASLFVTDQGDALLEWLGTEGDGLLAVGEPAVRERAAGDRRTKTKKNMRKRKKGDKRKRSRRRGKRRRSGFQVGVCPSGYEIDVVDDHAICMGRTRKSRFVRAGPSRCLEPAVLLEQVEDVDGVDQCELAELDTTQPAVCAPLARVFSEDGEQVDLTLKVVPGGRDVCMRKTFQLKQADVLLRSQQRRRPRRPRREPVQEPRDDGAGYEGEYEEDSGYYPDSEDSG